MKIKKRVAVLFSGGLDSTYLIYKNLKEGNYVYPIRVEIVNNVAKSLIEKQRVNLLRDLFNVEFNNRIDDVNHIFSIDVTGRFGGLVFKQLPIWLNALLYSDLTKYDEIHLGYVMNDDAISYIDDIKKLFNSTKFLMHENKCKLVFPLTKYDKWTIKDSLPENYRQYVFSCEDPQISTGINIKINVGENKHNIRHYKPCGYCDPCKKIENTYKYQYNYESTEHVRRNKEFVTLISTFEPIKKLEYDGE